MKSYRRLDLIQRLDLTGFGNLSGLIQRLDPDSTTSLIQQTKNWQNGIRVFCFSRFLFFLKKN